MRPFYLGVVLWGEEFRNYFLKFCLPSLLSPNNIPALENQTDSRFLICTTQADWTAMQADETFGLLKKQIKPVLLELKGLPGPGSKMQVMSEGHKALACRMHELRAYGTFIYPDTVFADGVLTECQRLAKEGKKVVLAHCPRFANEGLLRELAERGLIKPGTPITLAPRELIALALPHMHSESRRYEWEAPYFYAESPVMVWWQIPEGLLVHTVAWAPMVVDYNAITHHDTGTLDHWTIDGDYIHKNFSDPNDVCAVTESDSITLMSFTPESSLTYLPLRRGNLTILPVLGRWYRRLCLRAFLFSPAIDPLKRRLFVSTVKMAIASARPSSARIQTEAAEMVTQSLHRPPTAREQRALYWLRIINQGLLLHFGFWIKQRARFMKRIGLAKGLATWPKTHSN
jgi:hypothetical protein